MLGGQQDIENYGGFRSTALAFGSWKRGREGYSSERMLVQAMAGGSHAVMGDAVQCIGELTAGPFAHVSCGVEKWGRRCRDLCARSNGIIQNNFRCFLDRMRRTCRYTFIVYSLPWCRVFGPSRLACYTAEQRGLQDQAHLASSELRHVESTDILDETRGQLQIVSVHFACTLKTTTQCG